MKNAFITLMLFLLFTPSLAASKKELYESVSAEYNIPKEVLYALALTESGITVSSGEYIPWAFTLNWMGKAYRFNSHTEACNAVMKITEVSNSIDIGETQLHWKYHDKEVETPCDYFDRSTAIKRTAVVLNKCYASHKNWVLAAGCYHRPSGGELARIYESKFLIQLKDTIQKDW
ncbi:lytic transglycosylase [Vibrio vulnificus]|uniref:lytic transglycosylase n=1 Tax=Vibrio vulnificus TaxID=672 RepID=UPI004059971A